MPPFSNIPYGMAPAYCFPLTECCMYALFILCLVHALKQGAPHIFYLLGGLGFGLLLEYVNVVSNMGYVYGHFTVMFGKAPLDIPLCIGTGWAVIMYSSRLFTDAFRLPLFASAALDTVLAISIDLSMDTVAYRLHMWHWNWVGTGLNPLTADWFGIPYGNFFGWLLVVFFYSSFSRLLERAFNVQKDRAVKAAVVPLLAVLLSQVALYGMLVYVDDFLGAHFGVTALMRFGAFLVVLLLIVAAGWNKRKEAGPAAQTPSLVSWLVPVWFHLFFFVWLFVGGFYTESPMLVAAGCLNLLIGLALHAMAVRSRPEGLPVTALQ